MKHLVTMYNLADRIDREEGRLAYHRYYQVMFRIACSWGVPMDRVVAAFAALSPNSDYLGNVRSLVSVLDGLKLGVPHDRITVSTYKHCRDRAIAYLEGAEEFLSHAKGRKTRAFYRNIRAPDDPEPVTVDGHIYAIWSNRPNITMKDAKVTPRIYDEIAADIRELALAIGVIPNQLQATLWFTRKRVRNIIYNGQFDLFLDPTDAWQTYLAIEDIKPYEVAA